jgi:chaperonin cofactor prefoldin
MPPPRYDRQALEQERDVEIPAQIANYQRELEATPMELRERRERLEWQIRRVQKRMAQLETWLAQMQEKRLAE